MNTKLLKQKILDLAIRGKLTQQLKSDGTAADLLKEISSASHSRPSETREGIHTVHAKKGAKSKDLGQIIPLDKSEAPFEIPANWEWVRLGDVCELISGQDFPPEKYNAEKKGLPYITGASNFANNHVILNRWTEYPSIIAQEGDILLVCKGSGYGNYVYADFEKAHIARQIMAIRISDKTLRAYVYNFLGSQYEHLKFQGNGLVPGIARNVVLDLVLPLPPLMEQQRIVEKIQEAFAEIDSIENNKELLKTHIKQARQKILDLAIHGKLVPQNKTDEPASVLLERITSDNPHYEKIGLDERRETKDERSFKDKRHSREGGNLLAISKDEIPFDVPENWAWCRLGNILAPMQSASPKGEFFKYIDIDAIDNSICRIKAPKIVESKKAPSRASRFTKKDDILFSLVRPYLRNIAKVTENDCIASTGFFVCSPIIVNSDFCFYLLTSNYVVDGLNQFMKGDNSPSISSQNLVDFTIPLPPLNEQSRIVAKIEELFTELDLILQNT